MQTIALSQIQVDPTLYGRITEALQKGNLVCIPTQSGYKLMADLSSPAAVELLLQAKCRMKNSPALVFVPSSKWADRLASDISGDARRLMAHFWPGQVTLLFKPGEELHPEVKRSLTKARGWLGLRVPEDHVAQGVLEAFGRPLLVSSANLSKKGGHYSVAQIKKNFGRTVSVLVDAGDLMSSSASTLVDVSEDAISVVRPGPISPEQIQQALEN